MEAVRGLVWIFSGIAQYMKIIYVNCGVKNYMKEDHRNYIRNFCSCKKKAYLKKKFRLVPDSYS